MNPLLPVFATAAVALLGLIITKETKVSDFRQAWIDALRLEVAELLASIHMSLTLLADSDGEGIVDRDDLAPDTRASLLDALRSANAKMFTIRMRLNPIELPSGLLLQTLNEIETISNDKDALANAIATGRTNELERILLMQTNVILSAEWKRVKAGEPYFKWARRGAAFLAMAVVGLVIVQAAGSDGVVNGLNAVARLAHSLYVP